VKTYNTNAQTPDSAGTATAFNSGIKTKAGVVGLAEGTIRGECDTMKGNEVLNFAQQAHSMGKRVGVISTARITHATPACVYAQSVDRNFEAEVPEGCGHKDIASQLLDAMSSDCHYIDLAMGGGRAAFLPEDTVDSEGKNGYRLDGRDLIEEAKAAGVDVVQNTKEFQALKLDSDKPVLGLFESSHMMYEYDRQDTNEDEPSLAEMTAAAIEKLSASGDGFYLMIEAGRVDHANHGGNLRRMMDDGVAYNDAIAKAMELVDLEETLIISTAVSKRTSQSEGRM
jgi:alkaline phosphatase